MSGAPSLSVIVGSPTSDLSYVVTMLRWIGRQLIASQIEMIVVSAPTTEVIPPEVIRPFYDVKSTTTQPITNWADAVIPGIALATAEIVVLAEDHAFPQAGWAEAMVAAHRQGHRVVGPVVGNANPKTGQSCTHWVIDYGRWMVGSASGVRPDLPGHNTSYRRELLMQFNTEELRQYLSPGGHFNTELHRRGVPLYLASDAIVHHTHPSRLPISLALRFNCGRLLGAGRVQKGNWSLPRRGIYALAAPVLLLMRWRYVLQSLAMAGQYRQLRRPRVLGWLMLGLLAAVAGEACGYLLGFGNAVAAGGLEEFHKYPQMCTADVAQAREEWAAPAPAVPQAVQLAGPS